MESVGILQVLWRRRFLVAVGFLLSISVAVFAVFRVSLIPPALESRATTAGYAIERVLVDTPTSLVADARAAGAASIVTRSALLGDLMAGDDPRSRMARKVGIRPDEIGVTGPGMTVPQVSTPLAEHAVEVTRPQQPYTVTVNEGPSLSLLSIVATAPTPAKAEDLAVAATGALESLAQGSGVAGGQVNIETLGSREVGTKALGPRKAKAAIEGLLVFVVWCLAIAMLDGAFRRRHLDPPSVATTLVPNR